MCHTSLFVYLFTFVIGACVAFFICLFPLPAVSDIDRQCADAKSNCTHHIRRGLGRRLRSSLLLNLSPSTSRDASLSQLAEIHWSPAISSCSDSRRRLQTLPPSSSLPPYYPPPCHHSKNRLPSSHSRSRHYKTS